MSKKKVGRPKKHAFFKSESGGIMTHYDPEERIKFSQADHPTVEISMELDHVLRDTDGCCWRINDDDRYITVRYEREEVSA
tara:strand:- start:258 stop:500 length:243 start_codon:yes stop_codon:yes gene_type:complete